MNLDWFHCVFLILLFMATVAPVHALKLCVVGGGAAGYFAAIQAAQSLREVCGGRQSLLVPYVGIHLSNTPLLVPLYSVAWRIIR
jgi:hypothetical protein